MVENSDRHQKLTLAFDLVGKDSPRALQLCEEYRQEDPHNDWVYHVMYMAHCRMKNYAAAYNTAQILIERKPDNDMSHYHRAEAAYYMGKYAKAITSALTAYELNEDKTLGSMPYRLMALSYAQLGDLDNARLFAAKIHEREPGDWFPPLGPLPAGTKEEYMDIVCQIAEIRQAGWEPAIDKLWFLSGTKPVWAKEEKN